MSVRVQQGLAVAAATVAGTAYASRHLDRQRRPLQGFNAPTMSAVLTSLRTSGVGVVDGVVDRGLISAVQATSVFRQMPKQMPKRLRERPPREWRLSALGRYHRRMDEGEVEESDVQVFEQVEQRIWPLVDAFFKEEDEASTEGIFRSEMQILNALPGSVSQTWHSDNRSRGLTIIVPLVDFTAENGSTQLIVGSHNKTWPLIAEQGGRVVEAPVGSIAVFDSRTYHRGLGNETNDGRPALIFCYDRPSSPPPGYSGVYGSISHALLAGTLNIASAAWITCADAWTRE